MQLTVVGSATVPDGQVETQELFDVRKYVTTGLSGQLATHFLDTGSA
jgi:hypothetical protein